MNNELKISTPHELESWLKDKPIEWSQVISVRTSLRNSPWLLRVHQSRYLKTEYEDWLVISNFRAYFISYASYKYSAEEPVFSISNGIIPTSAVEAAVMSVNAIFPNGISDAAEDIANHAASTADAEVIITDIWSAISHDVNWLNSHLKNSSAVENLINTQLWPDGEPDWVYKQRAELNQNLIRQSEHHKVWINWYKNVLDGKPFFGLSPDREKELTLKIANEDEEFWQQDFTKVSEDISKRLQEARIWDSADKEQQRLDERRDEPEEIPEPELQKQYAVRFLGGDNEPINVDFLADTQALLNDEGANDRHSEVVRLAEAMVSAYDPTENGANAVKELIDDVILYRKSLGNSPLGAKPDLLVPRGDALRMFLEASNNKDEDISDLPPISDKYILALDRVVKAHNPYVSFDPTLAARDEALLGPDAEVNMISPDEGRRLIESAVVENLASPEVELVLAEEAKVAPDVPDPNNRKSRRYSEGVKNFARRVLSILWKNKGKIAVTGATLFNAAQWILANEAWLLKFFANNPAMKVSVVKLLELLKTLPLG